MKKTKWLLGNSLFLLIGVAMMGCTKPSDSLIFARRLPEEINGWQAKSLDKIYNFDNLYDYIDGGAEVYRSFNVRTVLARRYVKGETSEIYVDVFDMGSSKDAFGVYHHAMHDSPQAGIGQESEFTGSSVFFWKGQYYISIIAMEETQDTKDTVLELGQLLARSIEEEGTKPDLLQLLPQDVGQLKEVHYFHDHHCLNRYYYLADENLLNLDRETEAVLARYQEETAYTGLADSSSFVVLVIRYGLEAEAEKAAKNFLSSYLPDAAVDGTAKREDGKWTAAQLVARYLIAVFDTPSKEKAQSLLNEVSQTIISKFKAKEDIEP